MTTLSNSFRLACLPLAVVSLFLPSHAGAHGVHFDGLELDDVVVEDEIDAIHTLGGITSSQGVLGQKRLANQNPARSSDVLEAVPGLNVTQHSGGGKANQYFLRGFSLDHGTDLSVNFLGAPLNLVGHAHGQGYADSNMIIPELLSRVEYRKGPYFAQDGDFSTAGSLNLDYVNELKRGLASVSIGEFGYRRGLLANSFKFNDDQTSLLYAFELTDNNGPWDIKENQYKHNMLLKLNHRIDSSKKLELNYSGYESRWTSTDHIPVDAVAQGVVGRFGSLDSSAGGFTQRHALSGNFTAVWDQSITQVRAYVADYKLDLYSDFTYGLRDNAPLGRPGVLSDQFNQFDSRTTYGGGVTHTVFENLSFVQSQLALGVDYRIDDVKPAGLYESIARQRLATRNEDSFEQRNLGLFVSQQVLPLSWVKLTGGLRYDQFDVDLNGQFDADENVATPNVLRSGSRKDTLLSPKFSASFTPFEHNTELFFSVGRGFHSNDPRGLFTAAPVDSLVKTRGVEAGVKTTNDAKNLSASATLFQLKSNSELVFVGDAGTTEPNGATQRNGLELIASYFNRSGFEVDGFITLVDARFVNVADNGIPNAIEESAAVSIGQTLGDFKLGYKLKYIGSAPLVEDRSIKSDSVINSDLFVNYKVNNDLSLNFSIFNLFDRDNSDIQYAQDYFLAGNQAFGKTFHPALPRHVRLTANWLF
ncbi:MAG: TonB-dependent receptor [Limnobacter sp.]|uniref:TonB-dependent receptor n=1 Tax=Limnobacter sp. TaxID=2003368 RepID=UPI0022BAD824|nr:TonB-dependent receptor [Limnobacter sp.]MCZ8016659.1 TonB-dependent receptor [Limnobacter sp.]